MSLIWNGDDLIRKTGKAQKIGINRTMGQTVEHAKRNHAWKNRTGILEGSISISLFAHKAEKGFSGAWGSKAVIYALIHELGGTILPKKGTHLTFQIGGNWVRTKSVTIPKRPYLRPAADAIYPKLVKNIKEALAAL